jgi:hypothetical protein
MNATNDEETKVIDQEVKQIFKAIDELSKEVDYYVRNVRTKGDFRMCNKLLDEHHEILSALQDLNDLQIAKWSSNPESSLVCNHCGTFLGPHPTHQKVMCSECKREVKDPRIPVSYPLNFTATIILAVFVVWLGLLVSTGVGLFVFGVLPVWVIGGIYFGRLRNNRCPKCGRWGTRRVVYKNLLMEQQGIQMQSRMGYIYGEGEVTPYNYEVPVPVTNRGYEYFFKCKKCRQGWLDLGWE